MKHYKAIFLDWDDTIGDWTNAEHKALRDIYVQYRLDVLYPTFQDYLNAYKPYNLELWGMYGHFSVLPGAAEAVRELAKRYPLTIISNGFKEVQYYKFEHSGLEDCLTHTIISEEVGINKPQPEIFRIALELNGVSAEQALMIGDSYSSDIAGAKNAGIDQVWLHEGDADETATYIVPRLSDVVDILK